MSSQITLIFWSSSDYNLLKLLLSDELIFNTMEVGVDSKFLSTPIYYVEKVLIYCLPLLKRLICKPLCLCFPCLTLCDMVYLCIHESWRFKNTVNKIILMNLYRYPSTYTQHIIYVVVVVVVFGLRSGRYLSILGWLGSNT